MPNRFGRSRCNLFAVVEDQQRGFFS
jgi:hypothetical protein